MIVYEANSLSTTDLLTRAIANKTFKEQSEKIIGILLPSMASVTMVLKINA